ncbi:nucleotidyltransferase family protein [Pseudomonas sp. UBA4194]|uniref:nucleotidyltransferase family protein n=1 Tax=Pseudomonas sp. UBA4194 TaxID=1947317 RepID=UPI0025F837C4|nr:nucleotidyltransferase family protein [Pseudomonas sp. UBA4194]
MTAYRAPCAVILAAGHGQRYQALAGQGVDKLLAPCQGLDGVERAVFEHCLLNLSQAAVRRVVVTRPHKRDVLALARAYDCEVVLLDSAGMGDSLAAGVAASADAAGWLICLGDMPFIQPRTFHSVLTALSDEVICVPVGQGGYGHPVAFGGAFKKSLLALRGDQGARRLFAAGAVQQVLTDDPGIYRDIDVPTDLG